MTPRSPAPELLTDERLEEIAGDAFGCACKWCGGIQDLLGHIAALRRPTLGAQAGDVVIAVRAAIVNAALDQKRDTVLGLLEAEPAMNIARAAIAAYAAASPSQPPATLSARVNDGYVLVPREPTIEMIYAGATVGVDKHGAEIPEPTPLQVDAAWRAMISAAPQSQSEGGKG